MKINFKRLQDAGFDVVEYVNDFKEKIVTITPAHGSVSLARKVMLAVESETSLSEQEGCVVVDNFIDEVQTAQIMRVIKES